MAAEVSALRVLKQISSEVCEQIITDIITQEARRLNTKAASSRQDGAMNELVEILSKMMHKQSDEYARRTEEPQPVTTVSTEKMPKNSGTKPHPLSEKNVAASADQIKEPTTIKTLVRTDTTEKDNEEGRALERNNRAATTISSEVLSNIISDLLRRIYTPDALQKLTVEQSPMSCSSIASESQAEKGVSHSMSSNILESVVSEILRSIGMHQSADSISSHFEQPNTLTSDKSSLGNVKRRDFVPKEEVQSPRLISSDLTMKHQLESSEIQKPNISEVIKSYSSDIIQQVIADMLEAAVANPTRETHWNESDNVTMSNSSRILYKIINDVLRTAHMTTAVVNSRTETSTKKNQGGKSRKENRKMERSTNQKSKIQESVQMIPKEDIAGESEDKVSK